MHVPLLCLRMERIETERLAALRKAGPTAPLARPNFNIKAPSPRPISRSQFVPLGEEEALAELLPGLPEPAGDGAASKAGAKAETHRHLQVGASTDGGRSGSTGRSRRLSAVSWISSHMGGGSNEARFLDPPTGGSGEFDTW